MQLVSAQLVSLEQFRNFEENPKDPLGAAYAKALDASVKESGFSGSLVVTPPVDDEHSPELAALYGSDSKFMMADGNKRLERLGQLGYRWAVVLPQPEDDEADATMVAIEALIAGGKPLLTAIRQNVKPGQKIAWARVNPRLTTPTALKRFVLGYDRGRAKFNEGMVQTTLEQLLEQGEDPGPLFELAARSASDARALLNREAEREQAAAKEREEAVQSGDAERIAAAPPPKKELHQVVAERREARESSQRRYIGPFELVGKETSDAYDDALERIRGLVRAADQRQPGEAGRLMAMLELAAGMRDGQDLEFLVVLAIEMAPRVIEREVARLKSDAA